MDEDLSKRIKDSYDHVKLPDDSFNRMLAELTAAAETAERNQATVAQQVQNAQQQEAGTAVPQPVAAGVQSQAYQADSGVSNAGSASATNAPECNVVLAPARKRGPRVLRFVLPAAACLMVALVAGAVAFVSPLGSGDTASEIAYTAASEDEPAARNDEAPEQGKADSSASYDTGISADEGWDEEAGSAEPMAAPDEPSQEAYSLGSATESFEDGGDAAEGNPSAAEAESDDAVSTHDLGESSFRIELASGEQLRVRIEDDGTPETVEASKIARYQEDAMAYGNGSTEPMGCIVYVTAEGDYAARFENDDAYYLLELDDSR